MKQRVRSQAGLARDLDISQPFLSRVLAGERDIRFSDAIKLLARVGWEVRITPKSEDSPVNRREFVAAVASIAFVPSSKVGPYKNPSYLRTLAAQLDHSKSLGGVPLVSAALRHVHRIKGTVTSNDRELQRAGSELARKASLVLYDAGRLEDADSVGRLALTLARKSDYLDGSAHAFENLCCFTERRDPHRAAEWASRGLALNDLTDEHRARLNARLASSLTKTRGYGVDRVSRVALDKARGATDFPGESRGVILGNAGISLARLGRYEEADQSFSEALQHFEDTPQLYCTWLAQQIKASLLASDPSQAAERMHSLAHVAPLVTSVRLDRHMSDILRDSSRWRNVPEMRIARDQLRSVTLTVTQR